MKRLNLGCGRNYEKSTNDITWVNSDITRNVHADVFFDASKDIFPFKDGEFDGIYCSGVLEQILENSGLVHILNECHRVLKRFGELTVIVPNAKYEIAHQDPMDMRKFTVNTFNYFSKEDRHFKLFGSVYGFKGWGKITVGENNRGIITAILKKCE